ncbi:MAG: 2-enoyl thioester reductase domain-containing protein [Burkholderiaceae bacterium]
MKRIELQAYGVPEDVARCVEVPDAGPPRDDQVVFDVLAFPINPADVSFCVGRYRLRPPLPATPGAECVGRVTAVGRDVRHVAVGDLVINLERENWAQQRCVSTESVIRIPPELNPRQAAMLRINPPTALLLLEDIVSLSPGDWVIQNAANSAVGRLLIGFARSRGLRTVNVVRRDDVAAELTGIGADAVLRDGEGLADRVARATGGARIRLAIDAVSGEATARLASCLVDEGTVCNYGSMSGEPPLMPTADVVYRGVSLAGFMLGRHLARRPIAEVRALYERLAAQMLAGQWQAPVAGVYPIESIREALLHAQAAGKHGKVLVAPNGPLR